jgi:undecaprenyl-diphosphatase
VGSLQALVLGVVQGLTEFLPVSSDGHLALTYRLFGSMPDLGFEVFLHLGTLLAMVIYFRSDIATLARSFLPAGKGSAERRIALLIVLATAISGVLALLLKRVVLAANTSLLAIGAGFLVTSVALVAAELLGRRMTRRKADALGWPRTAGIAVAQALATLPGVSRSGMTISSGMLAGLDRHAAARFSFLLGIPIIAAANVYEAKDFFTGGANVPPALILIVGFVAAAVSGYLAIGALLKFVQTRPLHVFAVYTSVLGLLTIAWALLS